MSPKYAISEPVAEKINESGVVAVIVIDDVKDAVPLANALLKGGVKAIELTLRTPAALDSARAIIAEVPEMMVGIGTVLTPEQIMDVAGIGAAFAVAPGCNPTVIKAAADAGLSFGPGIMTPSDIEIAVELGCRVLKYFPAESIGGLKHLAGMAAPYLHLGLQFIPLGGLNINNAGDYLASPLITAIGGSWIAKRDMIKAQNWETITENARQIRDLIIKIRS